MDPFVRLQPPARQACKSQDVDEWRRHLLTHVAIQISQGNYQAACGEHLQEAFVR
jgi:hypothetical protein